MLFSEDFLTWWNALHWISTDPNGMPANYSRSGKDFLQEWSEWHCHRCHARSVSKGVILQNPHTLHVSKAEAWRAD